MKFTLKIIKYKNPQYYFSFNLIDLKYINTSQIRSVNFVFCNLFFQVLKEKIPTENKT